MAFLGYVVTVVPLAGIVAAYQNRAFEGVGWHGGQYAEAFVVGTLVLLVAGAVLQAWPAGSAWRSVGRGILLAGVTGIFLTLIFMVLVGYALSHMRFV
ncbi:hypothetical protein GCM10010172_20480 [Paractinoplanes ferrugineus]|uniref:Uncharacterized protein n=1 Tax=Paractinoplanes ferrugineus TaxID=113564 RepID=A0A919IU19_9ACTN|nr:hypothetical protein [Actinoplanes ferrugineus]GIE09041.1 hypothetical protein Afe05nite_08810 [Actinoplanes ferrugineus]